MIIPGVTGCSNDVYVQELVHEAKNRGYTCAILNHLVPKKEQSRGLRLLDFSDAELMHETVAAIKEHLPECPRVYGVGFSLGGNYLLRSVGAPGLDGTTVPFNGVATVSQCFDVGATCARLQHTLFGFYDRFIYWHLREPFFEKRFAPSWDHVEVPLDLATIRRSVWHFDNKVRSKMLGYNSV